MQRCHSPEMFTKIVHAEMQNADEELRLLHECCHADYCIFTGLTAQGQVKGCNCLSSPKAVHLHSAQACTWKEHMSVSSTLIMAPALSNSPQ